ncbi:MAG: hypothetical protein AB4372_05365 [Xenococcus sp. (in: cyanobacteria)]
MLIKAINAAKNFLLLLVFFSISTNAAKANTIENKELPSTSESTAEQYLISQSLGHEEYSGGTQMSWDDYQTGTIVGINGSVASIVADDGTLLHAGGVGSIGDTVLIGQEDGKTVVLQAAQPAWVGTLQQDYGFSRENDRRSDPPLEARTAPLWQALGY